MLCLIFVTVYAKELLSVIQISKHGETVPAIKYTWDKSEWEQGLSDLTNEGILQHYLLGQEYRDRYILSNQLIPDHYNASLVYIRSTEFSRTISSAQAQMSGFFPNGPKLAKLSNKHKAVPPFDFDDLERSISSLGLEALPQSYQPVYIDMVTKDQDTLLLGFSKSCPKLLNYIKEVQNSPPYQMKKESFEMNWKSELETILNHENLSFEEAAKIGDALEKISYAGYDLPEYITDLHLDYLTEIRDYCNSYMFDHYEATQLATSELLIYIADTFEGLIKKTNTRKLSFFFAHDTTLIALLTAFNDWNGLNPPFASTLVFELYEDNKDHYIKASYNDQAVAIEGKEEISLNDFKNFVNDWTIADVKKACHNYVPNNNEVFEENYFYSQVS